MTGWNDALQEEERITAGFGVSFSRDGGGTALLSQQKLRVVHAHPLLRYVHEI